MNAFSILLTVLGVLLALYLIASAVGLYVACHRNDTVQGNLELALGKSAYRACKKQILAARDWLNNQKTEEVSVTSYDGLKLVGTFLPHENAQGTLLLFHGWRGGPIADFGYPLQFYYGLGLNILLVHQRAQGKSAGHFMTFGIRERRDVHEWVRWHTERFGEDAPVLIGGLSMGATTVLMSCGEPFEGNVRGVIADCGFTDPREILTSVARSVHLPAGLFVPSVGTMARFVAGFRLQEYSTLDAMRQMTLPVIFIHGEADSFVPCEMSKQNFEACQSADKTLLLIPGAKHGQSFPVAPERYTEAISRFVDRTIGGTNARG